MYRQTISKYIKGRYMIWNDRFELGIWMLARSWNVLKWCRDLLYKTWASNNGTKACLMGMVVGGRYNETWESSGYSLSIWQ